MNTLKLGVVCFSSYGGSGVMAAALAEGLSRRGHDVHLICEKRPGRPCEGPTVHSVTSPNYPVLDRGLYGLAMAAKIAEVAQSADLDVVHVHYAVPHAASAYLARQMVNGRFRLVTTLHGTDVTRVGSDPALVSVSRFILAQSDVVTVPSNFLRDAAYRQLDLKPETQIAVVPNFVDIDTFVPAKHRDAKFFDQYFGGDSEGPVLLHVSNFRRVKRVPELVNIFNAVHVARRKSKSSPVRLLLVGDGPERAEVELAVSSLGLQEQVVFTGMLDDVVPIMKHADLMLLPSETESFGLAALEAASCGLPVVATAVGGLPDIVVDQETGALTPLGDDAAMAQAILHILGQPDLRASMARAARARALSRFPREPVFDQYEQAYRG